MRRPVPRQGCAKGWDKAAASASLPTRTINPCFDAQHSMFPSMRKVTPPNMRFSVTWSTGSSGADFFDQHREVLAFLHQIQISHSGR